MQQIFVFCIIVSWSLWILHLLSEQLDTADAYVCLHLNATSSVQCCSAFSASRCPAHNRFAAARSSLWKPQHDCAETSTTMQSHLTDSLG